MLFSFTNIFMAIASTCRQCQTSYQILDEDLEFHDRVSPVLNDHKCLIPPPSLCPDCRQQRRCVWRNERRLYHRKCDLCQKEIISVFSSGISYTIYCDQCWWSDKLDARKYGRDFDFSRSFFEQFQELMVLVPFAHSYNLNQENSDYNNWSSYLKDCYLLASSNRDEDCLYGRLVNDAKDCVDCLSVYNSELCYECMECYYCYGCVACKDSQNCRESFFLEGCIGCSNCFGSVNLRQKQYYFFNEPFTKDQYELKMKEINLGDYFVFQEMKKKFAIHRLKFPMKYFVGEKNENVFGNYLQNCKDCFNCFDCRNLESCKYCYQVQESKDCQDVMTWGKPGELLYEAQATGNNSYHTAFVSMCRGSSDVYYSFGCMYCKHCFGCVSLKNAEYCIFNKQYTKEEYEELVLRIIEKMGGAFIVDRLSKDKNSIDSMNDKRQTINEYGEFFPTSLSPFAYNETIAQDFFPLTKEEVLARNWKWKNEDEKGFYDGPSTTIPSNISDATDDICKQILRCEVTGKMYKIISQELSFYRTMNLPIPHRSPEQRYLDRRDIRNPRKLWNRSCAKCGEGMKTSYAPERPEIVYCEKCYLESVY